MEYVSKLDIFAEYTKSRSAWAVYIADEMPLDASRIGMYPFYDKLTMVYPPVGVGAILDAMSGGGLFICGEHTAKELFGILNQAPYYGNVFAVLFGPGGIVEENT